MLVNDWIVEAWANARVGRQLVDGTIYSDGTLRRIVLPLYRFSQLVFRVKNHLLGCMSRVPPEYNTRHEFWYLYGPIRIQRDTIHCQYTTKNFHFHTYSIAYCLEVGRVCDVPIV